MICAAKSKSTGKQCGNLALAGQKTCRFHGGSAPQAKAKAVERQTEAKARTELGKLTALLGPAEAVEDPLGELLQLAGEAKRWKELLAGRVSQLTSLGYEGVMGEQVRHEVALLEKATDRMAAILTAIAKLNIDERLARISTAQKEEGAQFLFEGIEGVCKWLGLSAVHRRDARRAAAEYLRSHFAQARGEEYTPKLPPRPDLHRIEMREVEVVRKVEVPVPCPKCNPPAPPVVIEQPRELPPSRPRRQIEPYRPLNADGSVPGWENWA